MGSKGPDLVGGSALQRPRAIRPMLIHSILENVANHPRTVTDEFEDKNLVTLSPHALNAFGQTIT